MTAKAIRSALVAAGIALLATALAVAAVQYLSFLASLENVGRDVRVGALSRPVPQSTDIVIAGIDESTVAQFPYRSPIDRAFLAGLIRSLEAKGASQIGIDVLFDGPTEPAKDAELKAVLRAAKVPLFVSYTNSPSIVNPEQLAYLNDFVPPNLRAGANLMTDPFDGSVRWIFPGETDPGMPLGFVRKSLALRGIATPNRPVEIAWRPRPDAETPAFATYPSQTMAFLPDDWIKGKIVLVGAILSITDRHRTPLAVVDDGDLGMMPGIVVQANGIAQYLDRRGVERLDLPATALVTLLVALCGVGIGLLRWNPAGKFGLGAVVLLGYWAAMMLGYRYGIPLVPLVAPTLAFALAIWLTDVVVGRSERRQRQFIQGAFSRYVSPAVVDQLAADPQALSISGERREVTFVFTDIAGFTTLSEELSSEVLSDVLNAYLDGACAIILSHQGTIDKFIGDAIMVIFNAPIAQVDHAARAVRCALELDAYAERFRTEQIAAGVPFGVTRIGVHTGSATVGNFGSSVRMDFTALGDTVNTAARTEGVNKYFGTRVCVTEATAAQCPDIAFLRIGRVVLKGKTQPVALFVPVPDGTPDALPTDYDAALTQLDEEAATAPAAFAALQDRYPDDPVIAFHRKRIERGIVSSLIVLEDK